MSFFVLIRKEVIQPHLAGVSSAPIIFVPADRQYIGPELDIIPPLGNDRSRKRRYYRA